MTNALTKLLTFSMNIFRYYLLSGIIIYMYIGLPYFVKSACIQMHTDVLHQMFTLLFDTLIDLCS